MSDIKNIIKNLLGKIYLTKTLLFGAIENKIIIVVSPSMKIFDIDATPKRLLNNLPFESERLLNSDELKNWAEENEFDITFSTDNVKLARKLMKEFGNVLIESEKKKEKELSVIVLEELEKSTLPPSIREWAINNPEKFAQNIKYIQELLKK